MANVVAVYESAAEARAAMTLLERKGVDGADIELGGPAGLTSRLPMTNEEQRHADGAAEVSLERRSMSGVVIGIVVLGGLGVLLGWIFGGPSAALVAGVGGAAGGTAIGFFYGGVTGLSMNPSMGDTFVAEANDGGEAWVEVRTDGPADDVVDALRGTNPIDVRVE